MPGVGLAGPAYFFAAIGFVVLAATWRWLPDDTPGSAAHGAVTSYPSIGGNLTGASVTAATADRSNERVALTDPRIWPWMLIGLVMGHAQAMVGQAIAFLAIDRLSLEPTTILSQQTISIILTAGAGAALLVQWGVIPQMNMKPRALVLVGLVLAAIGSAMIGSATSLFGMATAFAIACAGFGFVNGASFVLGPSIGIGLYEIWQPLPYLVSAVACAVLAGYAWRVLTRDA